jgi:hypothetical protein
MPMLQAKVDRFAKFDYTALRLFSADSLSAMLEVPSTL